MSTNRSSGSALYLSWRLPDAHDALANKVIRRLNSEGNRHLYRLRSWVIAGGEVHALMSPSAPVERIASAVWSENSQPLSTRWIRPEDCARVTRYIETTPVSLGLAARPEQWPYSSAACY